MVENSNVSDKGKVQNYAFVNNDSEICDSREYSNK